MKFGFWEKFRILLSRADIVDNRDKWKVPRRSRQKCRDFDMSYVLDKNAYFSQEERHKQGEFFCCLVFKSFHVLKCDILGSITRLVKPCTVVEMLEAEPIVSDLARVVPKYLIRGF